MKYNHIHHHPHFSPTTLSGSSPMYPLQIMSPSFANNALNKFIINYMCITVWSSTGNLPETSKEGFSLYYQLPAACSFSGVMHCKFLF